MPCRPLLTGGQILKSTRHFSTALRSYNREMPSQAMETAHAIKWEHGTISRQPLGYSDIYWCEEKNGPTVYLGKGEEYRKAYRCQLCGQRLTDDPNPHAFVAHIEKT